MERELNIALRMWERNEYLDRMIAAHTFERVRQYLRTNPNPELNQLLPRGWQTLPHS
jgi:hypothetical protein